MGGICTDFGAILILFPGRRDELRQSLQKTGVMGIARMEFQVATTANPILLREPLIFASRIFSSLLLKVARLGLH